MSARVRQPSSTASLPSVDARAARVSRSDAVEQMADATMRLARRTEALEDFAALVAHELKSPLEAALLADEPRRWIESALDLVESLLQAATDSPGDTWASLPECLTEAACCLHPLQLTIAADEGGRFPLAPDCLSVILRNLLANAVAARSQQVHVFTKHRGVQWRLIVEDDGVGLDPPNDDYKHGTGIGLELCRRIAERNGGWLDLVPDTRGGTRAILTLERVA